MAAQICTLNVFFLCFAMIFNERRFKSDEKNLRMSECVSFATEPLIQSVKTLVFPKKMHMKSGHSKGRNPQFFKNRFFGETNS